jgi:hypothetical protein
MTDSGTSTSQASSRNRNRKPKTKKAGAYSIGFFCFLPLFPSSSLETASSKLFFDTLHGDAVARDRAKDDWGVTCLSIAFKQIVSRSRGTDDRGLHRRFRILWAACFVLRGSSFRLKFYLVRAKEPIATTTWTRITSTSTYNSLHLNQSVAPHNLERF